MTERSIASTGAALGALVVIGGLMACASDADKDLPAGPTAAELSLEGTRWGLTAARLDAPVPEKAERRVRLDFLGDRLLANSGCNSGRGTWSVEGGRLLVGPMATTQMACIGDAERFEPAFFAILNGQPRVSRDGETLLLAGEAGELRFRAQPRPSASAVQKFIYVASERKPCTGVAPMQCLQIRENPNDPWQHYYGEIIDFEHEPGIEYRLRILEDTVPNPPADASSKKWFLDLVVEQRVVSLAPAR
jgi:heat shock protein HslJ